MSTTTPPHDLKAIARAIREYNAAHNSCRRAFERLFAVLPRDTVVLLQATEGTPKQVGRYWIYELGRIAGQEDPSLITDSGRREHFGTPAIIVEGPAPTVEYLPELL